MSLFSCIIFRRSMFMQNMDLLLNFSSFTVFEQISLSTPAPLRQVETQVHLLEASSTRLTCTPFSSTSFAAWKLSFSSRSWRVNFSCGAWEVNFSCGGAWKANFSRGAWKVDLLQPRR